MAIRNSQSRVLITMSVRDQVSGPLRDIAARAGQTARSLGAIGRGVGGGAFAGLSAGIRTVNAGLRGLWDLTRPVRWAAYAAAGVAAYKAIAYAQSSITEAANRQAQEGGLLNILNGDQAQFRSAIAEIKRIERLPGIDFEQALKGFSQLKAVNVDTRESFALLEEFANAVALAGGGVHELSLALRGLSQSYGKGKIMGEELNQQILEQAPIIRRAIGDAYRAGAIASDNTETLNRMGYTAQQFWSAVLPYLQRLPRAFGGAKVAIENTAIAWREFKIAFGKGLMTGMTMDWIGDLAAKIQSLLPQAQAMGARIGTALRDGFAWVAEWFSAGGWDRVVAGLQVAAGLAVDLKYLFLEVWTVVKDLFTGGGWDAFFAQSIPALSKVANNIGDQFGKSAGAAFMKSLRESLYDWASGPNGWKERGRQRVKEWREGLKDKVNAYRDDFGSLRTSQTSGNGLMLLSSAAGAAAPPASTVGATIAELERRRMAERGAVMGRVGASLSNARGFLGGSGGSSSAGWGLGPASGFWSMAGSYGIQVPQATVGATRTALTVDLGPRTVALLTQRQRQRIEAVLGDVLTEAWAGG